jgi:hypothetical protein
VGKYTYRDIFPFQDHPQMYKQLVVAEKKRPREQEDFESEFGAEKPSYSS